MCRGMMSLGLCALLLPSLVFADRPRPPDLKKKVEPQRRGENVPLTITYDKDGKTRPQLTIPKKFMVAVADGERVPRADGSSNRLLFTGLAFSAALVTGGLWFVRRSGKAGRGILVSFILSSVLSLTAFLPQVTGNIGLPEWRLPKLEIDGNKAKMEIDVVISDGDRMELVLPAALAPAPAPAPAKR